MDWYGSGQDWAGENSWSNGGFDPFASRSWGYSSSGPYAYRPAYGSMGAAYDPSYGYGTGYDPVSGFTTQMITGDIERWLQEAFPENYQFDTGAVNAGGTAGNVSTNPSFGQFSKDPTVFTEIEAAANKYGVPANLLKVMIGRESSGDWSGSNTGQVYLPERGHYIVGYTGITQPAAAAWGYEWSDLVGNRALQIEAMANGLSRLYGDYGAQYGWDGVIAAYYSGDPTAATTPSDSYQYGTTQEYVRDVKEWWNQEDAWVKANGGTTWTEGAPGMASPGSTVWQPINQYDQFIATAANQYGVPANLVKAVIKVESEGVADARNPSGATGLMQIMPGIHNNGNWQQLTDPAYNIDMGTRILRENYDQYGTWEHAVHAYLGGTPGSGASDGQNTQFSYWNKINNYWKSLDAEASGLFGGEPGTTDPGPVTSLDAIWGGQEAPVTQEFGATEFSLLPENYDMYDYAIPLLGTVGHPAVDYGMPIGTKLYSPVGGEVIVAGPEGGYVHDGGGAQTGQLRIRMDNGHELILGHMAGIYYRPGDRVSPGDLVGVSGTYGTGPHLHLEYQIPVTDGSWPHGNWKAVDPRQALQGLYTGGFSEPTARAGVTRPFTYEEILRQAAMGKPVDYGATMGSLNTWNSWLRQAMEGNIPHVPGTSGYEPNAYLSR